MATLEMLDRVIQEREAEQPPAAASPARGQRGVFPLIETTMPEGQAPAIDLSDLGIEQDISAWLQTPAGQRIVLETVGGVAGLALAPEILVARFVTKFGPKFGAALARAVSAGIGQGTFSLGAESFDPSENPALSAATSAALGATAELGGAAVVGAAGKALAPFASKLTETGRRAIDLVTSRGGTVTPGSAIDSPVLDKLESVARNSFFGGPRVLAKQQQAEGIAIDAVEEVANRFASTSGREEIGQLVQELIEEGSEAFRATARGLYGQVDELTQTVQVDLRPIKQAAKDLLDRSEAGIGSPIIRRLERVIGRKNDSVPFVEAQELRSDLLGIGRQTTDIVPSKGPTFGGVLARELDEEMATAAKALGDPKAIEAWRTANSFWKLGKTTFNSKLIKGLARAEPEAVFERIVRPGRPGTIRAVRQTINDPEIWRSIQGQFLRDLLRRASDPVLEGAELATREPSQRLLRLASGERIVKQIANFGDDAVRELFPEGLDTFVQSVRVLARVQSRKTGAGMRVGMLETGGVLLTLVSGGEPLTAGTIALGPSALAWVLTSKTGSKWLTTGLQAAPGSRQATEAFAQLTGALAKEGLIENVKGKE